MTWQQSKVELERLVAFARVGDRPGWMAPEGDHHEPAAAYATIGDDIALPLARRAAGWLAMSCVARGTQAEHVRARKRRAGREARAKARERRAAVRARRDAERAANGRPVRWAS